MDTCFITAEDSNPMIYKATYNRSNWKSNCRFWGPNNGIGSREKILRFFVKKACGCFYMAQKHYRSKLETVAVLCYCIILSLKRPLYMLLNWVELCWLVVTVTNIDWLSPHLDASMWWWYRFWLIISSPRGFQVVMIQILIDYLLTLDPPGGDDTDIDWLSPHLGASRWWW